MLIGQGYQLLFFQVYIYYVKEFYLLYYQQDFVMHLLWRLKVLFEILFKGGGLNETKCILTGGNTKTFFDIRVFIVKFFATIFMMSAGFPFGLIATNVHMGASIAHHLHKFKFFK